MYKNILIKQNSKKFELNIYFLFTITRKEREDKSILVVHPHRVRILGDPHLIMEVPRTV